MHLEFIIVTNCPQRAWIHFHWQVGGTSFFDSELLIDYLYRLRLYNPRRHHCAGHVLQDATILLIDTLTILEVDIQNVAFELRGTAVTVDTLRNTDLNITVTIPPSDMSVTTTSTPTPVPRRESGPPASSAIRRETTTALPTTTTTTHMETNDEKDNTSAGMNEIRDILQKILDGRERDRKDEDERREFEEGKLFLVSLYFLVLILFFWQD